MDFGKTSGEIVQYAVCELKISVQVAFSNCVFSDLQAFAWFSFYFHYENGKLYIHWDWFQRLFRHAGTKLSQPKATVAIFNASETIFSDNLDKARSSQKAHDMKTTWLHTVFSGIPWIFSYYFHRHFCSENDETTDLRGSVAARHAHRERSKNADEKNLVDANFIHIK